MRKPRKPEKPLQVTAEMIETCRFDVVGYHLDLLRGWWFAENFLKAAELFGDDEEGGDESGGGQ